MLRHFDREQEWPSTFVRALDCKLTKVSVHHLKLPLEPIEPCPPAKPARNSTKTVSKPIEAAKKWNATGIHLNKGTRYRISLASPIDVRAASIRVMTLQGWPSCWQRVVFFPLALLFRRRRFDPWFALIGSVDKKRGFRIREDAAEVTAPATGELFCYFNDVPFFYKNNDGTIRISVDVL
jgi:hypothetical protein